MMQPMSPQEMERWIDAEREAKRNNRYIFGMFRWRYHLDRLFTLLLRLLGRHE